MKNAITILVIMVSLESFELEVHNEFFEVLKKKYMPQLKKAILNKDF